MPPTDKPETPEKRPPQKRPSERRESYRWFLDIPTRWMDNDVYGHVNNVTYYSYFDTAINRYLIDAGGFDFLNDPVVGITPETFCRFHASFAYPELVQAGLRVGRLGTSSVRYEIGLFGVGDTTARADGHFVHVFVKRGAQTPVAIPETLRTALARIAV
jgi:acyl-CoA thioester hydrolase